MSHWIPDSPRMDHIQRDAWRYAGELYGHLSLMLGFGDLSLRAGPRGTVVVSWTFKAGQRYCCQHTWSLLKLALTGVTPEDTAERLAEQWKDEHRTITA